ncbi:hypothetical protein K8640_40495 [Myxococcus sp. XM-1-1-1]|uniref:hypothetical protein n=1 Tax=Myxococcus sp. XM-1-1-1 TaxID=2874602 RepID=UPI001CBF3DBA|nr:hypothetical protein [Myxococcus sp. XM-1-1-1]MBZ4414518.1 hypothetical protein [Myxococcus sp. XM-1-1-1]
MGGERLQRAAPPLDVVNGGNRTAAKRAKPFKLPDPNPSDEPVYGPAPSPSGSDARTSNDAS